MTAELPMLWILQGKYPPYGWEDLTGSEDRKEVVVDLADYRLNSPGAYRIIRRRQIEGE